MTPSSATASSRRPHGRAQGLPAILAWTLLGLAGCGAPGGYDIALPPPSGDEPVARALPLQVGGEVRRIEPVLAADGGVQGVRARYGTLATIELLRAPEPAARRAWFDDRLGPRLAVLGMHRARLADRRWQATGADGTRLLAWQNQDWLFLVEAASGALFDEAVGQLPWIAPVGRGRPPARGRADHDPTPAFPVFGRGSLQ